MTQASGVVRVDVEEALMTPDLRILAQRKVFWYVQAAGVPPSYAWRLDVDKLRRGERLADVTDRLHLALLRAYQAEARAAQAAAPDDPNRSQPLSVSYRVLNPDEAAQRPWVGTHCLRLTEQGTLEKVSDRDL
jgi:hypothetical protein